MPARPSPATAAGLFFAHVADATRIRRAAPAGGVALALQLTLCLLALSLAACAGRSERPELGDPTARDRALDAALGQLGAPYRYGGNGPAGFDCSGLVQYSYRLAGIELPRSAPEQLRAGQEIDWEALRPGDLLFYRFPDNGANGLHVVMWLGGGRAVHAPSGKGEVEVIRIDVPWWNRLFEAAVAVAP